MACYGTGDNAQVSLLTLRSHKHFLPDGGKGHFMRQRRSYIILTSWAILLSRSLFPILNLPLVRLCALYLGQPPTLPLCNHNQLLWGFCDCSCG